jgi:hypothetical protein
MAEFNEAAVLDWVRRVPGLATTQSAAAAASMAEDEYEGAELVGCTAKTLRKLLKGSGAEEAVPLLLAARDAHLAAEHAQTRAEVDAAATKSAAATRLHAAAAMKAMEAAMEAAAKAAPSCGVCFEPYRERIVPRILVACGHTFCEPCLTKMLRCATPSPRHNEGAYKFTKQRLTDVWSSPLVAKKGAKLLECPKCRKPCAVKGGRAAELPTNYDIMGA